MRQRLDWTWLPILVCCSIGCGAARRPYLDDPLLASKKIVDGKAEEVGPLRVAFVEPRPPEVPPTVLALAPLPSPRPLLDLTLPPAPTLADHTEKLDRQQPTKWTATPVARSKSAPQLSISTVFAHAADYRWLQGIFEIRAPGEYSLRFADTFSDSLGGKVRVLDDPRLTVFQTGDVVWLAGELSTLDDWPRAGAGDLLPTYRIHAARLAQPPRSPVVPPLGPQG
jgi:hypothetical protein